VLVHCDLKTTRSHERGEPVPELGEGLYVVAVARCFTPAERRPSLAHRTKRMEVLERRLGCRHSERSFDQPAPSPTLVMPSA
jgi:hypothetical protein